MSYGLWYCIDCNRRILCCQHPVLFFFLSFGSFTILSPSFPAFVVGVTVVVVVVVATTTKGRTAFIHTQKKMVEKAEALWNSLPLSPFRYGNVAHTAHNRLSASLAYSNKNVSIQIMDLCLTYTALSAFWPVARRVCVCNLAPSFSICMACVCDCATCCSYIYVERASTLKASTLKIVAGDCVRHSLARSILRYRWAPACAREERLGEHRACFQLEIFCSNRETVLLIKYPKREPLKRRTIFRSTL